MSKTKTAFGGKAAVLISLLLAYFLSILFQLKFLGDILSPLAALTSAGILWSSYHRSDRSTETSRSLLLVAAACTVWSAGNILWAGESLAGRDPAGIPLIRIFYTCSGGLLLTSFLRFAAEQYKRWDFVQFFIDIVINGFLAGLLIWILFLRKDASILKVLLVEDFTSVFSLGVDILVLISVTAWSMSVRTSRVPTYIRIITLGLILFAGADLFYYYLVYRGLYVHNSVEDFAYLLALAVVAFGGLWKIGVDRREWQPPAVSITSVRDRWFFLLLYPFVCIFASVFGLSASGISAGDVFWFAGLIALYLGASQYVQVSLERDALLRQQNKLLEKRVSEQIGRLAYLANQDTLTSLYNRRYFTECLDKTIQACRDDLVAVMTLDLDRFKAINDMYGHDVGDQVLVEFSGRLIEWNAYGATIARLGGNEFAILLSGKYTTRDVEEFCLQLLDCCGHPICVGENSLNVTVSVGVALKAKEVHDAKTLLKNADIAMYSAKSSNYNKYQFYDEKMEQDFRMSMEIENLLRQADFEKDFILYYQPQFSLPDGKMVGAEALIRWESSRYGLLSPGLFIPIAEETGYIYKIGNWVAQEAIRQAKDWNAGAAEPLKIGFNISPKQLGDKWFVHHLEYYLTAGAVDPAWIDVEITESAMMRDGANFECVFRQLRNLGLTVSIDDFGSGYSTLGCLNRYAFDRIKIDKSLIDSLSAGGNGGKIAKAAIALSHSLGVPAVAEGIETRDQLKILNELGCDQVQGYLFGKPVPAAEFERMYLRDGTPARANFVCEAIQ